MNSQKMAGSQFLFPISVSGYRAARLSSDDRDRVLDFLKQCPDYTTVSAQENEISGFEAHFKIKEHWPPRVTHNFGVFNNQGGFVALLCAIQKFEPLWSDHSNALND